MNRNVLSVVLALSTVVSASAPAGGAHESWRALQTGVAYRAFKIPGETSDVAHFLHVVRIDPAAARVMCATASSQRAERRTAGDWCRKVGLAVAINAGMFASDGISNVGYLRSKGHVNNPKWNAYRSVLCLYPSKAGLRTVRWLDREKGLPSQAIAKDYSIVVQNLRLIRSPGRNVWEMGPKRWSEAAVALDRRGRLLFLFSRPPMTMHDFNRFVMSLPLEIDAAMHVEGGPEASLSIHAGGVDVDLYGSHETGFMENDSNDHQWQIPNVLGVRAGH